MAQSNRLPLSRVRLALRLVGECRDLGHDPAAWLGHANRGLLRLLGARVINGALTRPEGFRLISDTQVLLNEGWGDPVNEERALALMAQEHHLADPTFRAFQRITRPNISVRPVRLVPRRTFERSEAFANRRWLGIEDFMFSQRVTATGAATVVFSPQRAFGDRSFSPVDLRLLRLFHDELALLVGTVLSDGRGGLVAGLPPRLRQTLAALLEGDSEKEAALRLGLSRHTVHEYVAELYRRFGVHSRAELLALCLRRRVGPREALG